MIINMKSAKKFIANDKQKSLVYSFDNLLVNLINGNHYPKLHKDLPKSASIKELAANISKDFNLDKDVMKTSNLAFNYYENGRVYITPSEIADNCLETLLHEFAHLFCDYFFKSESQKDHDGHFMCAFRFLLDYYEIIKKDDFNAILENNFPSIELFDDFIETFEYVDEVTLYNHEQNAKKYEIKNSFTIWANYGTFERKHITSEHFCEHFIKNTLNNEFIYIKLKRAEYEKSFFSNTNIDEMRNIVILSPPYLMDDTGERVTSSNFYDSHLGFCDVDGSMVDNSYSISKYPIELSRYTDSETRKDLNKSITEYSKKLKAKGKNVIRTKSAKEFFKLYWEIKDRCRELKQSLNHSL